MTKEELLKYLEDKTFYPQIKNPSILSSIIDSDYTSDIVIDKFPLIRVLLYKNGEVLKNAVEFDCDELINSIAMGVDIVNLSIDKILEHEND